MKKLLTIIACSTLIVSCSDDDPVGPSGFSGNADNYFPIPTTEQWVIQEWDDTFGIEYDTINVSGPTVTDINGESVDLYTVSQTLLGSEYGAYFNDSGLFGYATDGTDDFSFLLLPATMNEGTTWTAGLFGESYECVAAHATLEIQTADNWVGNFEDVLEVHSGDAEEDSSVSYYVSGVGLVYQENMFEGIVVSSSTMIEHNGSDIGWALP